MKRVFVLMAAICLLSVSVVNAQTDDIKAKVKGKWEITIPDAPGGYDKYVAEFKEKDGVVVMDFSGGDLSIKEQKFTIKDGKLNANLYVGEYVQIVIWDDKGTIKGTADTSMGKLPFNMKKVEEKK